MNISTYRILACALLLSLFTAHVDAQTATPREVLYRKNIDELSAEELAAFEHAVKMMKVKSARNIYDRTGFLWQAWVHNCTSVAVNEKRQYALGSGDNKQLYEIINQQLNTGENIDETANNPFNTCRFDNQVKGTGNITYENPGMCEHRKDTFFQWHRAEFYFYEKALQDADPEGLYGPSTKNVTVPYWNFTKPPTGSRYPKAFEDTASPLWFKHRLQNPPGSKPDMPSYTSPYLLAYLIYRQDWPSFGGYPTGSAAIAGNPGNSGSFESQIHDAMHDEYVNGYMRTPSTAGLDPLFYSFHAFVDYALEKWIEEHGTETITGGTWFMRGEQDERLLLPSGFEPGSGQKREPFSNYTKNMGRAELYYDTRKQGFAYQAGAFGEFVPRSQIDAIIAKHNLPGATLGDGPQSLFSELMSFGAHGPAAKPDAVVQGKVRIQPLDGKKALIDIVREAGSDDYSYQVDVYFHPQNIAADIGNKKFRARYLVLSANYWALSGHHHHDDTPGTALTLTQDISKDISNLRLGGKDGQEWTITLGISSRDNHSGKFSFNAPVVNYSK
ncbi:tyrosinase family protein [Undibacterium sp. TS12]|uniref:tyrosinase family protein n=1 Tax=Undibacterium sp. TS12 TaxID=2908202 RepID=UPI001F4D0622|nr:tyrosinase family protein [Undibacterium sp. TS12]MCH8617539.1 tyrosinase family protein [Undibacterium sp. TS12]